MPRAFAFGVRRARWAVGAGGPGGGAQGPPSARDGTMQAIWTALHTPSMTLPTHRGPNNLPVGIQLVGQRYDDDRLFACARWIWQKIGAPEMIGCRPVW